MKRETMFIALAAVLSLGATLFFAGCGGSGGGTGATSAQPQATKAGEVIGFNISSTETEPVDTVPKNIEPECGNYVTGVPNLSLATARRGILQHEESFTSDDGHLTIDFTITNPGNDGWFFNWINTTHANPAVWAVVVNSNQGGYVYVYDGTVDRDSFLHAAEAGGNEITVYHKPTQVSFCYAVQNGNGNGNGEEPEGEGCTLGYWGATRGGQNENGNNDKSGEVVHGDSWPASYSLEDTLSGKGFEGAPNGNDLLLTALHYKGGPTLDDKKNLLLKQAVAALLNAAHTEVNYPMTEQQVKDAVNLVLALDENDENAEIDVINLQMDLNILNNLGCPLN